jgi:hypothetical protein
MKKPLILMLIVLAAACTGEAQQEPETSTAPAEPDVTVLGNTVCPVMGAAVVQGQHFDWEGYRIGICCPGCGEMFAGDPSEYLPFLIEDPGVSALDAEALSALLEQQGTGQ